MNPELQLLPGGRPQSGRLQNQVNEFCRAKRRRWQPKTATNYTGILRRYVAHVGPDHWPPTRQGVLNWLDAVECGGAGQTSLNTYWIHLRTFFNFLEKSGEILPVQNPARQIKELELAPEAEDLEPVAYPPEDLQELFDLLADLADTGDVLAIRDLAILRFAYVTSAREGEIVGLLLDRLDLDVCEVSILAETSKSKKFRTVYFDDQVARDLAAWLEVRPSRRGVREVFVSLGGRKPRGSSLKPTALNRMLRRRCKEIGIFRRKFHALRHSSVLDALDEGISPDKVQKQAGHACITTTLKYMRGRDEDRAQAYRENSLSDSLARRAAKRSARGK